MQEAGGYLKGKSKRPQVVEPGLSSLRFKMLRLINGHGNTVISVSSLST
jgi:hypothetical protein